MLRIVLLVALVSKLNADALWRDCTNPSSPVHITRLDMEPNPVVLPGPMLFTMEGYSNRTLGSSALHLDIVREGSWFNFSIPCIGNIGSCTYEDMCTMLDDMDSGNWLGITRDLSRDIQRMLMNNGINPGLCSQPPQSISILRNEIQLPSIPAVLYWFAEGVYRARVRVTDNVSDEELVYFVVRLRMKQACSGFWDCIFK